jgi:putative ABC transport system ATP-binding protein
VAYVEFRNVKKIYKSGEVEIPALAGADFSIEKGEFCVIVGASGAGKTTILNILGGMDALTSGSVFLDGKEISAYNRKQLTEYRRNDVGFVFQFYNLMPNLTALENVEIATEMCRNALSPEKVLEAVGLKDRMANFPGQLSGGEQQRVSIARALAKNPRLLLCDEPTGALDYATGKTILKLLQDACKQHYKTVVVVTHNSALKDMADKVVYVKNGLATKVERNATPKDIAEIEW